MLDFEEARRLVLEAAGSIPRSATERVAVSEAGGRVLAEDVLSPVELPSADYSAMDGYAVRAADLAEPTTLPVVGECQTGHEGVGVGAGESVRIFTGARIPEGADTVVMQENVERDGELARFVQVPTLGANIRRAGEDLKKGGLVLPCGVRLAGFHLGLLATAERTEVLVARRPRVAIVCTGDELRPAGALYEKGHLAESNSVALAELVRQAGGEPLRSPIARDDLESMKVALSNAARGADLVLTVGGVSVGDHDVVAPALQGIGAETIFHKVKIKPGKPVLFSRLGDTLILGLPGNPSSAQVNFALFGFAIVRILQGDQRALAPARSARLKRGHRQKPGRRGFYRAFVDGSEVEILKNQASGDSTSMAWANALVVMKEECSELESGELVEVLAYADL